MNEKGQMKIRFFRERTLESFDHRIDFDENFQHIVVNEHNSQANR
jgi:hypothetical protein